MASDQSCHPAARILHLFCSATLSVWLLSCGSLSGWCTSAVFLLKQEWMQGCVAPSTCWTISLDSPETSSNSLFQNSAAWSFFATGWKETFYFCSGVFITEVARRKWLWIHIVCFRDYTDNPKLEGTSVGAETVGGIICLDDNFYLKLFAYKL